MTDGAAFLSLAEISQELELRSLSARELVDSCIQRINAVELRIRAFVEPTLELARHAAASADEARARGRVVGPLAGVPIALKDGILTRGVFTRAGSQSLRDHVPTRDAELWRRLDSAGAGLLGKTTMHEFAYGTTSPPTVNPWDARRSPGGSSGGSAAALAARMVPAAFGTDTGGSLRIPASACGVSTLRTATGKVPMSGIIALSPTLDVAGPMARRMLDVSLLMQVVTGCRYPAAAPASLRGMTIGLPRRMSWDAVEPSVAKVCQEALDQLAERGARLVDIELPVNIVRALRPQRSVFDAINTREAYRMNQRLERWLSHPVNRDSYTTQVRDRLDGGRGLRRTAGYWMARIRREAWRRAWLRIVAELGLDVIAHPTLTKTPPLVQLQPDRGPSIQQSLPWSVAGFAALSVPVGLDAHGMPVGLSLAAPPRAERELVGLGIAVDEEIGFWRRVPPA